MQGSCEHDARVQGKATHHKAGISTRTCHEHKHSAREDGILTRTMHKRVAHADVQIFNHDMQVCVEHVEYSKAYIQHKMCYVCQCCDSHNRALTLGTGDAGRAECVHEAACAAEQPASPLLPPPNEQSSSLH